MMEKPKHIEIPNDIKIKGLKKALSDYREITCQEKNVRPSDTARLVWDRTENEMWTEDNSEYGARRPWKNDIPFHDGKHDVVCVSDAMADYNELWGTEYRLTEPDVKRFAYDVILPGRTPKYGYDSRVPMNVGDEIPTRVYNGTMSSLDPVVRKRLETEFTKDASLKFLYFGGNLFKDEIKEDRPLLTSSFDAVKGNDVDKKNALVRRNAAILMTKCVYISDSTGNACKMYDGSMYSRFVGKEALSDVLHAAGEYKAKQPEISSKNPLVKGNENER